MAYNSHSSNRLREGNIFGFQIMLLLLFVHFYISSITKKDPNPLVLENYLLFCECIIIAIVDKR